MSRDHTEIIYAQNIHSWIDEQMQIVELQREQWKSEYVLGRLHERSEVLSEISALVSEMEITVAKDLIVESKPGAY